MAQTPRTMRIPELASRSLPDARMQPLAVAGAGVPELTLAARLGQLAERMNDRADRVAVNEAASAGLAAGEAQPGARMEGGGSLVATAFNRAATEAGARRLEVNARDALDRLSREHEADPDAFSRGATAFRDGMLQGLPDDVRARAALSFDTLARPYFNQVQEVQRRRVADQNVATYDEALPRRIAALDRLGRQSIRDPQAATALRLEEQGALDDLVRLGPRTAFTIGGREYPADPTRSGALTVEQLVAQRRRLLDTSTVATALGGFEAGPRTEAWVDAWVARELSPQGAGLTPDLVRRIERDMRAQVAETQGRTREEQGRAWAGLQERIAGVRAGLAMTGQEGDRITDEELTAAGRSPDQIAAYRREVAFGQHAFAARREVAMADGPALDSLEARVMPGGDLFALSPGGALRIAEQLAQRRTGAARDALQQRIADARVQAEAGAGRAPRFATRLPDAWRPIVAGAAQQHGVPEGLARELIGLESGGNAGAVSPAGAVGPAQIMPATARAPGFGLPPLSEADLRDPAKAIPWGMRYLAALRDKYGGDMRLALAAYNAGPGRVDDHLRTGQPLPAETRRYVAALAPFIGAEQPGRVTAAEASAAGLTAEDMAAQNRAIEQAEDRGRLRQVGAQGSPEDIAQARAGLPLEGADAAENAARLQALEQGVRRRVEGVREAPADYVQAEFPIVAEQWTRALEQPERTGFAIQATLDAQERLGVPEAQRQAVPRGVAQALVQQVQQLPTETERLQRLSALQATIPDTAARAQMLQAMRGAGLPENLAIAAAVQPRAGTAVAARLAGELAVDVAKLGLQPAERRSIAQTATAVFDEDDRLGGLRRAQYEATRSAAFLQLGEQEQQLLSRLATVRGAPGASLSSSDARGAYQDLFGGRIVVNQPRAGVLVSAPAGTDAAQLTSGLVAIARARLAEAAGGGAAGAAVAAQLLADTVWVDVGARDFMLYGRGAAGPLPGPDGQPMRVTLDEALGATTTAADRSPSAPARRDFFRSITGQSGPAASQVAR
jgi:soluble lytic murein transglycosylase-like protein